MIIFWWIIKDMLIIGKFKFNRNSHDSIKDYNETSIVISHDEVFLEEIEMVSEVLFTKKKNLFL